MFVAEVQQVLWGYATEGIKGEEDPFVGEVDQNQKLEQAVMCCQGLVQVRTLAAQFYTYWSLSRPLLETNWTDQGLGVGAGRRAEMCLIFCVSVGISSL